MASCGALGTYRVLDAPQEILDFKVERGKNMTIAELVDGHLKKMAARHDAFAKGHRGVAKSHLDAADHHTAANPTLSQIHRDISDHHSILYKSHQACQQDFEDLREGLAVASDAEVLDSHSDAGDDLKTAAGYGALLKSMRLVPE
jgi:hypothetical protein